MEPSRQEYWSGLPFPPPEDLPTPRIELRSLAMQADSLPCESPGKMININKLKERIPDLFFNHFETLGLMEEETGGPEVAIYARGHTASLLVTDPGFEPTAKTPSLCSFSQPAGA